MSTLTLAGTLLFTGDGYVQMGWPYQPRSWPLVQADGNKINLRPLIIEKLKGMDGKPVTQQGNGIDSHSLVIDSESEMIFRYNKGHPWLSKPGAGSNVMLKLKRALGWLTGRKITIQIGEHGILIEPDQFESVYGVRWQNDVTDCPIPDADALAICKAADEILDNHAKGWLIHLGYTRIGNCDLVGRVEKTSS